MPVLKSPAFLYAAALALLAPAGACASMFSDFVDQTQEFVADTAESVQKELFDSPAEPTVETPAIPVAAPVVATQPALPTPTPPAVAIIVPADTPVALPVPVPAAAPEELLAQKSAADDTAAATQKTTADNASFSSMLAYVYANHPQLKAQREALKATDESVAQALSGFRPDVSADMSKGRERLSSTNGKWNYNDTKSRGLTVTQPLFNGGETLASFTTAKDRVKAARAELSALEQQVLYNAVVAYTDVVEKQSVLELNQKNVDVLKQQLEATQARFDVGELTVTDVAQSTARLSRSQSDERQALGDLEAAKATFKRTIGYDVPEKIDMPNVPSGLPATVAEANSWAQDASPILEAARHNANAAEDNVYVHGATILPDVTLQGTMDRSTGGSITGLRRFDNDALVVNLSIPIYQSGAEWSRLREARNQAQQAKFNVLDTNESVVESTARAWEDYNTAASIITSSQAMVEATQTALNGVRKENEFGVRTVLDVLDAEQEAFAARVNLVKATRAEKVQAYRLLATVGKLTANDLKLETNVPDPKEHYDSVKYQLLGL